MQPAFATTPPLAFATLLEQTESLRTVDHVRFLNLLKGLHQQIAAMSTHERWQLRYLDAWQASFQNDYTNADPMLHDIIDHSGDPALVAKASAVLVGDLEESKRYVEAFELADHLVAGLPSIRDRLARFMVLSYVSQLLASAGQYDLAANYIRDIAQTLPSGETDCQPTTRLLNVLYASHKLTSSNTAIQRGIDACEVDREPIFADTIWLLKASLYTDEDQPEKALALLQRITPQIQNDQYYSNTLASQVEMAQAYWKLGDADNARKAALSALASSDPAEIGESQRDAYQLLYNIEKKAGNIVAALTYHEHYVAQDIGYLNDVGARTLAYDVAQQQLLAQNLESERLSKQNNVLLLQQALATKAVEASRLYITLLLLALTSIIFWLFRLKRSQLRFKQLSTLDGLTGVFNHQHFISEVQLALRGLEKKQGKACLISIDLDHFKQINDTHGHAVGDAVLKHTVSICKHYLRPADLFGRLGGEEFGILLIGCSRDDGSLIAHRIRKAIESTPFQANGHFVTFSTSIGLVSTETGGYDVQPLCSEADAALYRAKRNGRNRVIVDTGTAPFGSDTEVSVTAT